jgi:hypothetical protein
MTQSNDDFSINLEDLDIKLDDVYNNDTITVDLSQTYGATTTYLSDDFSISDPNFSVSITDTGITFENWVYNNTVFDSQEIERMCKEYPSLDKVWRNFKSVYDMVKQDYEGKKKAGEVDDDIPF